MIKLAKSTTSNIIGRVFNYKNVQNFWLPLLAISIIVRMITSGNSLDWIVLSVIATAIYASIRK